MPLSPLYPAGGGGTDPKNYSLFWGDAKILAGGALNSSYYPTGQFHRVAWYQDNGAINDELQWDIVLEKGDYFLSVLGESSNDRAITTFYLNGNSVGEFDWFNGVNTISNIIATLPIVISSDGAQVITSKITGKNAGSTNFFMLGTRIYLKPA